MIRPLAITVLALTLACATLPVRPAEAILAISNETGSCTAWTVAPGWWLTAKHCLTHGGLDGWTADGAPMTVLAQSPTADIALLSGPIGGTYLSVSRTAPPVGATLRTYGYGLNQPTLLLFDGILIALDSTFFDGTEQELLVGGPNGMPGMSGGPILWHGQVVSQISGGGTASSPTHLVGSGVPYAALRSFVFLHLGR